MIFANQCLSAVSTTPPIKEENFEVYIFSYFVLCRLNFLFFIFRSRQDGIVSNVLSAKNVETILMVYSGARGTLIHEISCQTPFNMALRGTPWSARENDTFFVSKLVLDTTDVAYISKIISICWNQCSGSRNV